MYTPLSLDSGHIGIEWHRFVEHFSVVWRFLATTYGSFFLRQVGIVGKSRVALKTCKRLTTGWRPHRIAGFQKGTRIGKMLPGCSVGYCNIWWMYLTLGTLKTLLHWKQKGHTPECISKSSKVEVLALPWGWIFETSYPWHLTRAVNWERRSFAKQVWPQG